MLSEASWVTELTTFVVVHISPSTSQGDGLQFSKGVSEMNANDIVELLEKEWQSIREQLGEQWDDFVAAYREIVAALPEEPSRDDMERTADAVCQLMGRYDYTRGLLRRRQSVTREDAGTRDFWFFLTSSTSTLSEQEQVRQVCNRFRQLSEEFAKGKPQGRHKSQDSKSREGLERSA
jgi:hypothetical protein